MSRTNRSRIVLGSLAGAFAIHIAALACSGNSSLVGGPLPDAATADAGQVSTHDGGVLDAIATAFDAVGDAVRDVAAKVIDGEVHDAHAGGDAGSPTCACTPPPPEVTFTASVNRGHGAEAPQTDFSTATLTVMPVRSASGGLRYSMHATGIFYLADGAYVNFDCNGSSGADGGDVSDPSCTAVTLRGGAAGSPEATEGFFGTGVTLTPVVAFPAFDDRAVTMAVDLPLRLHPPSSGGADSDAGIGAFHVEVRSTAMSGLLPPIPRQYRP